MRTLNKEKQTVKNWHKILMRVQMVSAFKLSMRIEDQPIEEEILPPPRIELAWYESGNSVIYPENKVGLTWSVIKTIIIFISLFTLSYSAGFQFRTRSEMRNYEMFFDTVQLLDIILTCFTAIRSRDISDGTRQYF